METKNKNIQHTLIIKRVIDAPRNIVWEAWTDGDQVQEWWGPKGFTTPLCEWDATPGGRILIHSQRPDHIINSVEGEFREVDKPKKLVFCGTAFDEEGKQMITGENTIILSEKSHSTGMTVKVEVTDFNPEIDKSLEGMEEGWNEMLDKLEEYIAKHIHAEQEV